LRRVVTLAVAASIIALGVFAAVGPYQDYKDAKARLDEQRAQVVLLEQENEALQADVRRLQNPSHLEALARRDLNLGRPGEEIFVVEGIPSGEATPAEEEPVEEPGPLERLIARLRNLF
jgi:cell division protein FtsB